MWTSRKLLLWLKLLVWMAQYVQGQISLSWQAPAFQLTGETVFSSSHVWVF